MHNLKQFLIIIPSENWIENDNYYSKIHGFKPVDCLLLFPDNGTDIALTTMSVNEEAQRTSPPRRACSIFRFHSNKNFYNSKIINEKTIKSESESKKSDGDEYLLHVLDPFGNQFEIQFYEDPYIHKKYKNSTLTLFIPAHEVGLVRKYYSNIFSSDVVDGKILLKVRSSKIFLDFVEIEKDEIPLNFQIEYYPLFRIVLDKNFLSFCLNIKAKGAKFTLACSHPGGYFARIVDPAGNQFEIDCGSFHDDDANIDSSKIDGFFRY